jgi:hypothetical protein
VSDAGAQFDAVIELDAGRIVPQVTWGTSPEMVTGIDGTVPAPEDFSDPVKSEGMARALQYMGLTPRMRIDQIPSTRSSSAPAPTPASRTCARRRPWPGGAGLPPTSSWRWWFPAPA